MNVLIVDDDIYSIQGMAKGIRWSRLGIDEVYQAKSAAEARQIINDRQIDIMICDIEMPNENGLELIEWMFSAKKNPVIILYSCHADFMYARMAIKLSVFEYILKPAPYAEIEEAVKRAVVKKTDENSLGQKSPNISKRENAMREKYFKGIVDGTIPSHDILRITAMNNIKINSDGEFILILHDIRHWDAILKSWSRIDVEFMIKNIAREALSLKSVTHVTVFPFISQYYVSILESDTGIKEKEEIKTRCRQINLVFGKMVNYGMNMLISTGNKLEGINDRVNQLLSLIRGKSQEENLVEFLEEIGNLQIKAQEESIQIDVTSCYRYIITENFEEVANILDGLFHDLRKNCQGSYYNLEKIL